MTDKQRKILEKYLNKDNLEKLGELKFEASFIDMIFQNRNFHPVCGEICLIPKFDMETQKEDKENIKRIECIVNNKKKEFGLVEDEYAFVSNIFYFDEEHKWYEIKQTWFKGMSETPDTKIIYIKYCDDECTKFEGIYNELFDLGIYSMVGLVDFFFKKAKEREND